jgi:hypothetical protein
MRANATQRNATQRRARALIAMSAAFAATTSMCAAKTSLPVCGGTTGVECIAPQDISKTTCSCTCSGLAVSLFEDAIGAPHNDLTFQVPRCLPDAINANVTPLSTIQGMNAGVYHQTLVTSCDDVQTSLNAALPMFVDFCGFTGTPCTCTFDETTDVKSTGCSTACSSLPPVPCNTSNFLACDQVTTCGRPPGPVVCGPPAGFDPPGSPGVLASRLNRQSTLTIDPSQSIFNLQVNLAGDAGPPQANVSPPVHGKLITYGFPNDDGTADVQIDLDATIEDTSFTVQDVNANLTAMTAAGGTATTAVHLDSSGFGTIQPHVFKVTLDVTQNGSPTRLSVDNSNSVSLSIDFAHKTFLIPSIFFDNGSGITGNFSLSGTITNQPPHARASVDQVLECTSPQGAPATLDATASTDPDGDFTFFTWLNGTGLDPDEVFAHTKTTSVESPLGSTLYTVQVGDTAFQSSLASTTVTVRDTTPPSLTVSAQPGCLWAPNHKMVLYQLGTTLPYSASDVCDANPTVAIESVASNQADLGGGQGDFTPDIVFGKTHVCLRSEREGSTSADRTYTVVVSARDASGNTTTKNVVVTVPHDEASAGCPVIDKGRVVDANDPRCMQ